MNGIPVVLFCSLDLNEKGALLGLYPLKVCERALGREDCFMGNGRLLLDLLALVGSYSEEIEHLLSQAPRPRQDFR